MIVPPHPARPPRVCKHGHAGAYQQRLVYDGRRNEKYWTWYCTECALESSRQWKARHKASRQSGSTAESNV